MGYIIIGESHRSDFVGMEKLERKNRIENQDIMIAFHARHRLNRWVNRCLRLHKRYGNR